MFKKFFILAITAILGSGGILPFIPHMTSDNYYCDDSYSGYGTPAETHTLDITYDSYTMSLTNVDLLCPTYYGTYGSNACAPTAGSIITTYYDAYYPNLLPNYTPGFYQEGFYYWNNVNSTISTLQENLYNLMGTNTEASGTSVAQFKRGMTSYYNSKGYNISYNNISNSVTPTNAISYFNQEKPIILFLTSYDYYPDINVTLTENHMNMIGHTKTVGHVVIAYAYVEYSFYRDGAIFRTDKYLYVSFGDSSCGYLSINNTSYIQEAYTLNIT